MSQAIKAVLSACESYNLLCHIITNTQHSPQSAPIHACIRLVILPMMLYRQWEIHTDHCDVSKLQRMEFHFEWACNTDRSATSLRDNSLPLSTFKQNLNTPLCNYMYEVFICDSGTVIRFRIYLSI